MGLFEELEKEMADEICPMPEVVEVSAEDTPLATQITVWVFAICFCVVMLAGTWKLLTVWF